MNAQYLRTVHSLTVAAPIRAPGASPVTRPVRKLALAALILVATPSIYAADIGTAFTYQGYLESPPGSPLTDSCDFRFGLWKHATSTLPADQAGTSNSAGVPVVGGVFTTTLAFDPNAIDGTARWLEIEACCSSPCAPGGLVPLTPRIELTPAPHALALPGLYTQQNGTDPPNIIGGYYGNSMAAPLGQPVAATIAGGGRAGDENRVTDWGGTIGGGIGNQAGDNAGDSDNAYLATVAGGASNKATQQYASVGGGFRNAANGQYSTVSGGVDNTADGTGSTVAGGNNNRSPGSFGTVSGGQSNSVVDSNGTVSGGGGNTAGRFATVAGGWENKALANYATIGGGAPTNIADPTTGNRVFDDYGTVGGGGNNRAGSDDADPTSGDYGTIAGGGGNTASSKYSTVGGGVNNTAGSACIGGPDQRKPCAEDADCAAPGICSAPSGYYATVGGGAGNAASIGFSTISGGWLNAATARDSTVSGGQGNDATAWGATVGGGKLNVAGRACIDGPDYGRPCETDADCDSPGTCSTGTAEGATVGGGSWNAASGEHATIAGGWNHQAIGQDSTIGGGSNNEASGFRSTVPGGFVNLAGGDYSFAAGYNARVRNSNPSSSEYSGDADGDEGTFVWADSTGTPFTSTGPDQFLIRASGGVGIGTNNPFSNLHLRDDIDYVELNLESISSSFPAAFLRTNISRGTVSSRLPIETLDPLFRLIATGWNGTTYGGGTHIDITAAADWTTSSEPTRIRFLTIPSGSTSPLDRMIIETNGNVGIGTNSPNSQLHVNGGGTAPSLRVQVNGNSKLTVASNGGLTVGTFDDAPPTNGLYVAGNVGIGGAISPDGKLHVSGSDDSTNPHGKNAAITIQNNAGGGAKWYLRAGATGTATPAGGFSIANDGGYALRIASNRRVGIERDPTTYAFEVEGDAGKTVGGSDWVIISDRRIKTNIEDVRGALETLDRVHLVSFEYTPEYKALHPEARDRRELNVIAQEYAELFPDYVRPMKGMLPDGGDALSVDLHPLKVYSVVAIQELHGLVKGQKAQIDAQAKELNELRSRLDALEGGGSGRIVRAGFVPGGLVALLPHCLVASLLPCCLLGLVAFRRRSANGGGQ